MGVEKVSQWVNGGVGWGGGGGDSDTKESGQWHQFFFFSLNVYNVSRGDHSLQVETGNSFTN